MDAFINRTSRAIRFNGVEYAPGEPSSNQGGGDLGRMDKAALLDALAKHGWDGDKRLGADKLRAELAAILADEE